MLVVRERQHQRGRWIGVAEDAEDPRRIERTGAVAAQRRRHGQRQQSCFGQILEILEWKAGVAIVLRRAGGKFASESPRTTVGHGGCVSRWFFAYRTASHHVASSPSSPRMFRRNSASRGSPRCRG